MKHLTDAINTMVTEQLSDRQRLANGIKQVRHNIQYAEEWMGDVVNYADHAHTTKLKKIQSDLKRMYKELGALKAESK